MFVGKLDGRLVEVIRVEDTVAFSSERGWVMICLDFEEPERKKKHFKWIPASTPFEWVREFNFDKPVSVN